MTTKMIEVGLLLALTIVLACETPRPEPMAPEVVPLMTYIIPKNPSTKEWVLQRGCRLYLSPYSYDYEAWLHRGEHVITQEAEENWYMYKVFAIDDYESGFMNKNCFFGGRP